MGFYINHLYLRRNHYTLTFSSLENKIVFGKKSPPILFHGTKMPGRTLDNDTPFGEERPLKAMKNEAFSNFS